MRRNAAEWARLVIPPLVGLVFLSLAIEVLRVELRTVTWPELIAAVTGIPRRRLAFAAVLTVLNYSALTLYDQLAFAYIGRALPRAKIAAASFLAYAVANNVGFLLLSGASVRYRFYTRWGITTEELSRIVFLPTRWRSGAGCSAWAGSGSSWRRCHAWPRFRHTSS